MQTSRLVALRLVLMLALGGAFGISTATANDDELNIDPDQFAKVEIDPEDELNDPLEPVNRVIFDFNDHVQTYLLSPLAKGFNYIPEVPRKSIGSMLQNAQLPVTFVNDILQLEGKRALTTLSRFILNSTVGIAGAYDFAAEVGIQGHTEDFGQTLAVYGVPEIAYLVLPIFGPSNPRDGVGKIFVDGFFDPLSIYLDETLDADGADFAIAGGRGFTEYAAVVEDLEQLKRTSVDYYAAIRSLYRQRRAAEISNGKDIDLPPIPDLSPEFTPAELEEETEGEPLASADEN